MLSNSLGFYWPGLAAAGPGGSLDLGKMCPLPEPNTLAKNFQTRGRDIFSHGSWVLPRGEQGEAKENWQGNISDYQIWQWGCGSMSSVLVLHTHETPEECM